MTQETIRTLTTSIGALLIIIGGMLMLFVLTRDGTISGDAMLAIIGPLVGLAGAYLLQKDAASSAAKQATNASNTGIAAGVAAAQGATPQV